MKSMKGRSVLVVEMFSVVVSDIDMIASIASRFENEVEQR